MTDPCTPVEVPLWLECGRDHLFAVLHAAASQTGVVVIVGGPQYRVGSHRQFVLLARVLAAAGHPTLRFDMRGMGDSTGVFPGFENCDPDVRAAVDGLMTHSPGIRRVVLWGLCDGASAALLYLQRHADDARVSGLCLVNPWVRSAGTLAQTRVNHYYKDRLADPEFWRKLLTGGVSWRAPLEWLKARRLARRRGLSDPAPSEVGFLQRMLAGLVPFAGRTLFLLSGRDLTAQEFEQLCANETTWRQAVLASSVEVLRFSQSDHTFSDLNSQAEMIAATLQWMSGPSHTANP